jgi:hypothetical protein
MTTIIVSGPIANKPGNGGIVWNELSYLLGFRRLGFDVYFWEQLAPGACVDAAGRPATFEASANRAFFWQVLRTFGLEVNGALLCGDRVDGCDLLTMQDVAESAALLVNINGHLEHAELRRRIRRAVYVDEDPGYTQFWHAQGAVGSRLAGHDAYYTVGTNIGRPDCTIPCSGIPWRPWLQPVVLSEWPAVPGHTWTGFTTVASWRGAFGPVEFEGRRFGLKAHEFRKFRALPSLTDQRFELALDIHPDDHRDRDLLMQEGWNLVDPIAATTDPVAYRRFLQGSGAEFSVAQGIYVETNSGWISDRSARYLASGKPVLVQDTGFGACLPRGEGLLTFRTLEEAAKGAGEIARWYSGHCKAAREIAETYFDSDKVLPGMLDAVGVAP